MAALIDRALGEGRVERERRDFDVEMLAAGGAVLAVLPRRALDRFKGCLPELPSP